MRPWRKLLWIFGLAAVLWLGAGACSCENLVSRLAPSVTSPTATPAPARSASAPLPTLAPTMTSVAELSLPAGTDQPFVLELSEADVNGYLNAQALAQEGLEVRDVRVTLAQDEVIATLFASHAQSGLSGEVTLYGAPRVQDGQVSVQIRRVSLGTSFSGFTRLIAQRLIEEALQQADAGAGILVPIEGMAVESVEVLPGKMIVQGRTQ